MKTRQRFVTILTAALILSGSLPVAKVKAAQIPEEPTRVQENTEIPNEAPPFQARIHREGSGDYTVIGTFTDFTPDIIQIDTLYSLDGKNWQTAIGGDWNLSDLGTDDANDLYGLQNQRCLLGYYEPLKSYKAGETDHFYVKLLITKNSGLSYETQSVLLERGDVQPIPEGITAEAQFSPDIRIIERNPLRIGAEYQLTVPADAAVEDISALLPDTLPVNVDLVCGSVIYAEGVVDCPVTWKSLSLPPLSAGETITVSDAAEEIQVPKDTLLHTPLGIFQLQEPVSLYIPPYYTGEVRLVLNISPEDRTPTGALRTGSDGLEIALNQKPTGASSIQAYVLTEGESAWTELPGLSLLEEMNKPSSAANGSYALVLRNDQEPYQSYLAAVNEGAELTPFFIGLKINGGVYDGKQLILPWPDTYEELPDLPEVGGSGGNEGNAGADNKDDSTEGGQRPNLPQTPDDEQNEQPSEPNPDDNQTKPPETPATDDNQTTPPQAPATDDNQTTPPQASIPDHSGQEQQPPGSYAGLDSASSATENQSSPTYESGPNSESDRQENPLNTGQRPNLPQLTSDQTDPSAVNQQEGSDSAALAVQPSANTKEQESGPALSDTAAAPAHTTKNSSRIPLLPAAAAAGGICIGIAAVCKATGYDLFSRIAGKIRNLLHK